MQIEHIPKMEYDTDNSKQQQRPAARKEKKMKVSLQKDYKSALTMEEVGQARAVIKAEKEDDGGDLKEYAEMMIREALRDRGDFLKEIIKAEAETARNGRIWNGYGDTGKVDVWIEATAETSFGFIKAGAYLSDIWTIGAADIRPHMFMKYCKQ